MGDTSAHGVNGLQSLRIVELWLRTNCFSAPQRRVSYGRRSSPESAGFKLQLLWTVANRAPACATLIKLWLTVANAGSAPSATEQPSAAQSNRRSIATNINTLHLRTSFPPSHPRRTTHICCVHGGAASAAGVAQYTVHCASIQHSVDCAPELHYAPLSNMVAVQNGVGVGVIDHIGANWDQRRVCVALGHRSRAIAVTARWILCWRHVAPAPCSGPSGRRLAVSFDVSGLWERYRTGAAEPDSNTAVQYAASY
eukprot:SAG31_NODE_172_length_21357_cov_7.616021_19_plen_254_part_00